MRRIHPQGDQDDRNRLRISPIKIFFVESSLLLSLSLLFTYIVSSMAIISIRTAQPCNLGFMEFVPYVANNTSRFCSIDYKAVASTSIYFSLAVVTIIVSEILYRRSRKVFEIKLSTVHRAGAILLFWITLGVWFFGFEGRRGDYEFLTQAMYFKSLLLPLFACVAQLTMELERQCRSS